MGIVESLIFYGVIGSGVSVAVLASNSERSLLQRLFLAMTAILFWPIYLPVLLSGKQTDAATLHNQQPQDELSGLVIQVELELDAALIEFDGWGQETFDYQRELTRELKDAWQAQVDRIRELERVLSQSTQNRDSEFEPEAVSARVAESEKARRDNFQHLDDVRHTAREELMSSLACVRELVSIIHLSRFTDDSAARADEIASQLAAAVRSFSKERTQPCENSPRRGHERSVG